MWMFLFGVLPLLGLSYVLWHVWHVLPLANFWRWLVVVVGVLFFLSMFAGFMGGLDRLPLNGGTVGYETGNSVLFILLYLFMIFLVLDLGRLVHLVPRQWLFCNMYTSIAVLLFMVGVFTYGNLHYYNKVRVPLSLDSHQKVSKPQKIVLLSDLHLGYHNRRAELHRWVDKINAEKPDLILIAGDIIDMSIRPLLEENMAGEFHRLKVPVVACLGNHEFFSGLSQARDFYREAGITLLRDSVVTVGDIVVVGREDRSNPQRKSLQDIMQSVPSGKYTILLDHQPYHLEDAEQAGIDFQFSGHTHRGQVWPISWVTDALYEDSWGPLQKGNTKYYVSSGIGIWGGKFRIGTQSEYVVATVK